MTLDEFLEFSSSYAEAEALKLPSGDDLSPFLSYFKGNGQLVVIHLAQTWVGDRGKAVAMAFCRSKLKADRAQMYVLTSFGWSVRRNEPTPEAVAELERTMREEGTGGRYRDERKECILLSAGEPGRTVVRVIYVQRDYKGKIRQLIPQPDSTNSSTGRMVNLLD